MYKTMDVASVVLALLICQYQVQGSHHSSSSNSHGHSWDYSGNGPSTWGGVCNNGASQSPINIVTSNTVKSSFANLVFSHNYWKNPGGTYKMKNNGHALQIDLPKNTPYKLKKGDMSYIPLQFHIHFNAETGKGSEHTLNSQRFFAEIHIVHRNAKYTTKEQMLKNKDGLLVIGIFVELVKGFKFPLSDLDFSMEHLHSQTKTRNNHTSFAMQLFGFAAKHLVEPQSEKIVDGFPLAWLLPTKTRGTWSGLLEFVNYKGSLTTPPCSEVVDWIVITGRNLEVNEKTASYFKGVKNSIGKPMSGNFRPVQALNGRRVHGVQEVF